MDTWRHRSPAEEVFDSSCGVSDLTGVEGQSTVHSSGSGWTEGERQMNRKWPGTCQHDSPVKPAAPYLIPTKLW